MAAKKASNYYFFATHDEGLQQNIVWLAKKSFFDEHGHLDDRERGVGVMPRKFVDIMEACFEIPDDMTVAQARKELLSKGFEENPALAG